MKDFPQESIEQARWVVDKYRRRTKSKLEIAAQLYDNKFVHINYGFSEAIKKGNCGLYFHEIDKECDCFTSLGVSYLIAREASLAPKMWWAIGVKDVGEGEDISEARALDHGFITAEVGKDKMLLLDRQMGLYGFATFDTKHNIIKVYDKQDRKITYRHYQHLSELSEEEILEKLEKNRSSEGGRVVLATTQRVRGAGKKEVYLSYAPEAHKLKSSIRFQVVNFGPEHYNKALITDITTNVNENGTYDFRNGNLSVYYASMDGWAEHENPQVPIVLPVRNAGKLWKIWDYLMAETQRKSKIKGHTSALRLIEEIKEAGFDDNFTIKPRSKASKSIRINSLEKVLEEAQKTQEKAVNSYVSGVSKDVISYKSLLRHAQYIKALDKAKSRKNNSRGFVYSEKEHLALLEKEFENFKQASWRFFNTVIEQAEVRAGLKKGSLYHVDRKYNTTFAQESRNIRYLDVMGPLYNSKFPLAFHIAADKELFMRQFKLDKTSVKKLEEDLTKKDIKRAAQHRLYEWLVGVYVVKEALFLASYKKGLQKILDRRETD